MGSGVSKKVHQDALAERDQQIESLEAKWTAAKKQMESMVPKEEYETQKRELNSELETVQSKAESAQKEKDQQVEREKALADDYEAKLASLRGELEEETTKMKVLEEEKAKLARTLDVAGKALKHLPDYPHDPDEIARARGSLPLRPDVDGDVHAAIVNDSSILTPELQAAVLAVQTQMRDMESMQMAVKMSQDKVTEYWKKVQVFENQLMDQRKHILLVENHNELLKTKNTVTRMKARPGTRTTRSPTKQLPTKLTSTSPVRSPVKAIRAEHPHDFITD